MQMHIPRTNKKIFIAKKENSEKIASNSQEFFKQKQ